jgi:hypothetical protein
MCGPMEVSLHDWWPIRADARLADRLSAMARADYLQNVQTRCRLPTDDLDRARTAHLPPTDRHGRDEVKVDAARESAECHHSR